MKTTPLPEILKQITPLPYRWHSEKISEDGEHKTRILHAETNNTIARMGDPALDDSCSEAVDVIDAAYLAHAANLLPELVRVLGETRAILSAFAPGRRVLELDLASVEPALAQAQATLAKATTVQVP